MSKKLRTDPIFSRVLNERAELQLGVKKRQEIIKEIQAGKQKAKVKTRIVTYFSKYGHPAAMIDPNDTKPIDDMLRSVGKCDVLELVIHSAGGLPESARKIVTMLRSCTKELRVVIPDAAKSAATIIALASDKIVMSDSSELGPIDPQIRQLTPQGITMKPAWSIVKSFEDLIERSIRQDGSLNPAYIPILSGFDVSLLKVCKEAIENAENIAKGYLIEGMLKADPQKAEKTAKDLARAEKYIFHAHLIDYKEAQKLLGKKNIEYLDKADPLWGLYWELYCRSALFLENPTIVKLFETENNSVNISIALPAKLRP